METNMSVTANDLSPDLGVELHGFDPRNISPQDTQAFRRAFDEKHLVLVRGFDLSEQDSVGLAKLLGPVSRAGATMGRDSREFTLISNMHEGGRLPDGELLFHADHMFMPHPLKAISLYSLAAPRSGGETRFMNAAAAYRGLPEEIKQRIRNLEARHVYDYHANTANRAPDRRSLPADVASAVHPVVWAHPHSGEPILFVSRLFTVEILGIPAHESDALLEMLFGHLEAQGTGYTHKWRVNDFLIWDNRILQHARNDFPKTEKRAMRRVPIADAFEPGDAIAN
jgi:taurine dioxygenase